MQLSEEYKELEFDVCKTLHAIMKYCEISILSNDHYKLVLSSWDSILKIVKHALRLRLRVFDKITGSRGSRCRKR